MARRLVRLIDLAGDLDERLRVPLEVRQAATVGQNAHEALARELRAILKIGQHIRQFDVAFVDRHDRPAVLVALFGLNAPLSDGEIRLSDPHARFGYGRAIGDGLGAVGDQLLVIEVNAVGRLVLDAIPKRLELGAVQNGLPRFDDDALIGVLDIELAGDLLQGRPAPTPDAPRAPPARRTCHP